MNVMKKRTLALLSLAVLAMAAAASPPRSGAERSSAKRSRVRLRTSSRRALESLAFTWGL